MGYRKVQNSGQGGDFLVRDERGKPVRWEREGKTVTSGTEAEADAIVKHADETGRK